jgi:hypothetical protein
VLPTTRNHEWHCRWTAPTLLLATHKHRHIPQHNPHGSPDRLKRMANLYSGPEHGKTSAIRTNLHEPSCTSCAVERTSIPHPKHCNCFGLTCTIPQQKKWFSNSVPHPHSSFADALSAAPVLSAACCCPEPRFWMQLSAICTATRI